MTKLLIQGPIVHSDTGTRPGNITLENGKITALHTAPGPAGQVLNFPASYHVIPGMIDLHIHGAAGADVMDATPEALCTISRALAKEGTTGFLATTMTEAPQKIRAALANVMQAGAMPGAAVLGVHLEGPFLAEKRMGAQCSAHICAPDIALFQAWQSLCGDQIRLVTVAPETKNALPFIEYLSRHNVVVSLGHSDASFAEAQAGVTAGGRYATHLFNAMRAIHHREPGIAVALLLDERVTAELVLDGHHLHPAMVELAWKIKGGHRLVLVTDAMRAKCLGEGSFDLGGQQVLVKNGLATLANGTIAGSVLKLNQALKHFMTATGLSLDEALPLVSANPAKLLGRYAHKGSLAPGKDADLVVLNERYDVVATVCEGRIVYSED